MTTTHPRFIITDIVWDTDNDDAATLGLPEHTELNAPDEESVADALSDTFGYLVISCRAEERAPVHMSFQMQEHGGRDDTYVTVTLPLTSTLIDRLETTLRDLPDNHPDEAGGRSTDLTTDVLIHKSGDLTGDHPGGLPTLSSERPNADRCLGGHLLIFPDRTMHAVAFDQNEHSYTSPSFTLTQMRQAVQDARSA